MKKSTLCIVLCLLLAGMLPGISRAQQQATSGFAVFEEKVSTADMAAFQQAQQEAVDMWNKLNLGVSIGCYSTDDNAFFWVIPARSFASLDTIFGKTSAFLKKAKEQEGYDGSGFRDLSTSNFSFIFWRPDLSYHPEGYEGPSADKPYVEWSFCYMRQGHEKEAAAAVKKFVDFYKKNGIDYGWNFFEVALGYDVPAWIVMDNSTDALTMRQTEKSLNEKYGAEFKEMWTEFAKHVRHIENRTGRYMPKWSVTVND